MFSERRDMAAAKAFFESAKIVTASPPIGSPPMAMTVIRAQSERCWAHVCGTATANISTIDWSKIIAA
jgi:hypothetical protein